MTDEERMPERARPRTRREAAASAVEGVALAADAVAAQRPGEAIARTGSPASIVEGPSVDIATGHSSTLPGVHRGGFSRAFTEPVPMIPPELPPEAPAVDVRWIPPQPAPLPRSGPWALTFAIVGLIVSLFVGWGFLIGAVGIGLAVAALRRPWESTPLAVWALCLSALSLVYSVGWLWWASTQGPLFG